MNLLYSLLFWVVHLALVLFWPLVLVGVLRRTKARLACRRGPPLLQEGWDLLKLLRKEEVIASTSTWLFRAAPPVSWSLMLLVGLMIPTFSSTVPMEAHADLILIVYLLASARFVRTLAAMDTATAFAGLGASRENFVATLAEPALVLGLWCTGWMAGTTHIPEMVRQFSGKAAAELSPVHPLILAALILVVLAENGRIPFDDPTTHLELTMVHESSALEYSGRGLALIQWGAGMHLGLSLPLIANLFFPFHLADPGFPATAIVGILSFAGRTLLLALGIGILESTIARLKFFRISDALLLAGAASVLAMIRLSTVGR